MRSLLLVISICCLAVSGQSQNIDSVAVHRADSLYQHFKETKALTAYKEILSQDSTNFTALWRTSFLYSRIGDRLDTKAEQRQYFSKAQSYAERALKIDSTHSQSNYVMAVAMGRKALIAGARERVAAARAIKKYTDRAISLDSTNAGAWHLLGRWQFTVANLGFFERLAANTLFGGIPGDATNQKAADAIKKAVNLKPQYVIYYHDLAMVYRQMGEADNVIASCQKALKKPNLSAKDEPLKAECKKWINNRN